MPIGATFHLARVLVFESLEQHEVRTGQITAKFVASLDGVHQNGLSVEYRTCEHAGAFVAQMQSLIAAVAAGAGVPLLHVECHGSADSGLEFANGSTLSWEALSKLLVQLNQASRFNLVAVFAACYGAHFIASFSTIEAAPCYAVVAPTDTVSPAELLAGFRQFYSILFQEMDAGVAVDAMLRTDLQIGEWFAHQAEFWYEKVSVGYVESHCGRAEMKRRALRMRDRLRQEGRDAPLGRIKSDLERLNRENLLGKFFERYFMTDLLPENFSRFQATRERVSFRIEELRKTGRFGV